MVTLIDVSEGRRAEGVVCAMQARLERTAYELTENIPVGTYTMVQPAAGGMGSFQFLSTRFLDICGLPADVVRSDPFKAFAIVHPDDYDEWVRKNAEVFANKLPFYGECRLLVNGAVRWISAESQPRARGERRSRASWWKTTRSSASSSPASCDRSPGLGA